MRGFLFFFFFFCAEKCELMMVLSTLVLLLVDRHHPASSPPWMQAAYRSSTAPCLDEGVRSRERALLCVPNRIITNTQTPYNEFNKVWPSFILSICRGLKSPNMVIPIAHASEGPTTTRDQIFPWVFGTHPSPIGRVRGKNGRAASCTSYICMCRAMGVSPRRLFLHVCSPPKV